MIVLIVPLWNWNLWIAGLLRGADQGFNRTFMELKYLRGEHVTVRKVSFNRTFMELKYLRGEHVTVRKVSFNRTFMELKWSILWGSLIRSLVLIVPLWNWNQTRLIKRWMPKTVLIVPLWNWNRTSRFIGGSDSVMF